MLEELHTAGSLLRIALERYISACSALHDGYSLKNNIGSTVELLDFVNNELDLVKTYKSKLMQVEIEVKRVRNNLASVPVNALPPEILTHIFHLALDQQPCIIPGTYHSHSNPIALASHKLWSHIDIRLSCYQVAGFCARAERFVSRAQSVPLDIHFNDSSHSQEIERRVWYYSESEQYHNVEGTRKEDVEVLFCNPEVFTFLAASPRPRIRSLGLFIDEQYRSIHSKVLEYCLSNCSLEAQDLSLLDPLSTTYFASFLTEQQLEDTWRSITSLYSKGAYPRWSSTAYHGLTDLRLLGGKSISESELVGILTSSPGLRILHCDFNVHGSPPSSALVSQISLQELEALNLEGMDESNTKYVLGRLKPGPKSLRLSISGNPTSTMLKDFYAYSNVQEMRVARGFSYIEGGESIFPTKFFLPPQLRTLVIVGWGRHSPPRSRVTPQLRIRHDEATSMQLDTLYMLSCRYKSFDQFRKVVVKYSPRRLVLWQCDFNISFLRKAQIDRSYLESAFGNNMSQLCPSIEFPTGSHWSSFLDWD